MKDKQAGKDPGSKVLVHNPQHRLEKWKEDAARDGVVGPLISNLQSWNQEQVLALSEQIHREKMASPPDPQLYPETVGCADEIEARLRASAAGGAASFQEVCLAAYWGDVHRFVLNFRPEELQGRTWRQLRRSKGPLKFWLTAVDCPCAHT